MLKIKRLYIFIVQTFLPVFFMTFGICLFIVLMQFLWRYVEDLVGKGLETTVLAELFFYAALQFIPMALPLALLLASLMAFGNMGERLELLAIKASGVSLLKAMQPLIILVGAIAIGAFFFQNEGLPRINVKFRSLLISIKQKSPELDIPEGSFYSVIPDYSIYVKKKDPETKMLKDVMIYQTSEGFNNMSVFVCDSALMKMSEDKTFLLLDLYDGQRFANFRQADIKNTSRHSNNQFVPYSRENFKTKKIIIPFNAGFDRMDESALEGTQISKNIVELGRSIDSMTVFIDSLNKRDRATIGERTYLSYKADRKYSRTVEAESANDTAHSSDNKKDTIPTTVPIVPLDFDSLLNSYSRDEVSQYYATAANEAENNRYNIIEGIQKKTIQKNLRMHKVEWHRKFVLSFACLVFFFIGAPLGAIIRKGGLGMPVVVSVALYIVYYIVDNIGYKMARDAVWEVWQGMWLSSAVFFPVGVFLTYKAMNDSALFNPEAYDKFFRKILFVKSPAKINDEKRNEIIEKIPALSELNIKSEVLAGLQSMDSDKLRDVIQNYKKYSYDKTRQLAALSILKSRGAEINDIVDRQDKEYINMAESLYCNSSNITSLIYVFFVLLSVIAIINFSWIVGVLYFLLFVRSMIYYFSFYKDIKVRSKWYHAIILVLSLLAYPLIYLYVRKQMKKDKNEVEIITYT
ncbi:LptF/LptG family permease [Dysgonomonas sp. BGC7]|uniref:LptF/LptG family permease n=1 Tax=Dysgonomonas sp. BGC7 TaxID=1658008 RepID=UPI0006824A04|nr:LptF/LptG family permease [Dysgonomonas sp. BGC7]MBD8390163.1 LptF/LptG family permease [Dysgonomonas sp. BGC7]